MMRVWILALALSLVHTIASFASDDFTFREYTSPNGIQYNLFHSELQNSVAISLAFPRGYASDDPQKIGAAFLAPSLMLQGAGGKSAADLYESFQDYGGSLSISGEADQSYANITAPLKGISGAVEIANLVLTKPDFPERKFNQKKESLIERATESLAYPTTQLAKAYLTAAIEPHPYTNNYVLEPNVLQHIQYGDLKPWVQQHVVRKGVLIAVVGNLNNKTAGALIDTLLAGLPETSNLGAAPVVEFRPAPLQPLKVSSNPSDQNALMMGAVFPFNGKLEDWLAADLLNRIFVGDQKSRLFKDIREATGATYGLQGGLGFFEQAEIMTVNGRIAKANSDKTIALILQSWNKFRVDGPLASEADEAKAAYLQYIGNMMRNHAFLASTLRDLLTGGWTASDLAKLPSLIEKANLNDKALLARVFPENPIIVVTE
jgi:zinc protease